MRDNLLILVNPTGGSGKAGKRAIRIRKILRDYGIKFQLTFAKSRQHLIEMGKKARHSNYSALVIIGGDGTARDAAHALLGCSLPLGIIPGGTANVLSYELGMTGDDEKAVYSILHGPARPFDMGYAQYMGEYSDKMIDIQGETTFNRATSFLMMAGIGFDAQAIKMTHMGLKKKIKQGAYFLGALKALGRWKNLDNWAIFPKESETCAGRQILVSNIGYYAGPARILPQAKNNDGLLDIMIGARFCPGIFLTECAFGAVGLYKYHPSVIIKKAKSIYINGNSPLQLDGDLMGYLPAKISIKEKVFHMIHGK